MPAPNGIQIIAGLGNSGDSYQDNRHNAGFWFVEKLAEQHDATFASHKKFSGSSCRITTPQGTVLLFKPEPFINLSGKGLASFVRFHKVPLSQVLVVHDEIDFDNAKLRLKRSGGTGGHNGLVDIIQCLGADFWRLRIGVGHPGKSSKVASHVLSDPSVDERIEINLAIKKVIAVLPEILAGEFEVAMNRLHTVEPSEEKSHGI